MKTPVIILADGEMPKKPLAIKKLHTAGSIVCCDGAAEKLLHYGLEPTYIVGDLDSLSDVLKEKYHDRLLHIAEQDSNDLTKAALFCVSKGVKEISILGATGLREDHTLGNISLLTKYADMFEKVEMTTNYGTFLVLNQSSVINSMPGQQISIFALDPETVITTENLRYPITERSLSALWQGTLNEALGNTFKISFNKGKILVFM